MTGARCHLTSALCDISPDTGGDQVIIATPFQSPGKSRRRSL